LRLSRLEYDRDGRLVMIPQFPFEQPIPDAKARSFRTQTRYGFVWVALDEVLFRNDTEADCSTQELIDWDAAIIAEDRDMLETTDPDAIVDMGRRIEKHMPSDRPGMLMRKRLLDLLHDHNQEEKPRHEIA